MRVIHVVTLATPDGAYGGPLRVALNQARGLIEAGHDVTLAAGHLGYEGALPTEIDGVPVRLFPVKRLVPGAGFAGLCSPQLDRWLRKSIPKAEVTHIHLARDLITLPAAVRALVGKRPYVLQTHGMIVTSQHPLAAPLDLALTRRVLRGAHEVFFLTPREKMDLRAVAGQDLKLQALRNGVPFAASQVDRRRRAGVEVLFLARLHARKRPLQFVAMAGELNRRFPAVKFTLVGPDEGEGAGVLEAIRRLGLGGRVAWEGAISPAQVADRMRRADIYVLPAVNEPFGMTVVEAMSVGLPVVVTESCGLATEVRAYSAGRVTDESLVSLVNAVGGLLADKAAREAMGERAAQAVRSAFGMNGVVEQLLISYAGSVTGSSFQGGRP